MTRPVRSLATAGRAALALPVALPVALPLPVAVAVAVAIALALAGCGDTSADLFAVTRSGTVPGATFAMIVRDDGTVTCDGKRRKLPDDLLITARGIADDLQAPATAATALPSGPRPVFTYVVLAPAGRVSFSDTSPHPPAVFYHVALLTTEVARQVCRLPR